MVKVSVVIPVYNAEQYLPSCLESVLSQSLTEIEVICIDDACCDTCPQILDEYAKQDPRVRVIHLTTNHGQGHGRNLGLSNTEGQYVYFLDNDDELIPGALYDLYHLAEKDRLDGIFFDSKPVFETEELRYQQQGYQAVHKGNYPDRVMNGEELFKLFIQQDEWMVYVQRQFWRREYLVEQKLSFDEKCRHEDELFSAQALLQANRVRLEKRPYVIKRFRKGSIMTGTPPQRDAEGYYLAYCGMRDFLSGRPPLDEAEFNEAHLFELLTRYYRLIPEEEKKKLYSEKGWSDEYIFSLREKHSQEVWTRVFRERFAPLLQYETVTVYGAGRLAQIVYGRMQSAGINVSRFLVTHAEGNPETLFGCPVCLLDSFEPAEGEIVVVAIARQQGREVSDELSRRGIQHFCCTGMRLEERVSDDSIAAERSIDG